MTILEIVRAASELHMTYGEYVQKYDPPPKPKPPAPPVVPEPNHICPVCGRAFYHKEKNRKYCDACHDPRHGGLKRALKPNRKRQEE